MIGGKDEVKLMKNVYQWSVQVKPNVCWKEQTKNYKAE